MPISWTGGGGCRYQCLLQMYGEKAERAQELQLDLDDIKALLQTQTQQFLAEMERLKGAPA